MKNRRYYLILIFLACLINVNTWAQDKSASVFSGIVLDNSKHVLSNATIEVQDKNRRTTSNSDGSFTIECDPTDVLIFSKRQYKTIQKRAVSVKNLSIVLEPSLIDAGEEDDIQIPMGMRKKRELTYSVSSIKGDELPQLPLSNLSNILSGRLSGLYVQQTSTQPGNDNTQLQLRGRSTYNDGNTPRVLVDGVFRDFSDMDLDQIESVTVLKDASALTWYGMKAANGVVLITTKRGSSTKSSINFNSQVGFQQPINSFNPLNSYQYATLYNEALTNVGQPPMYDQTTLDNYRLGTDPYKYPDNNYQKMFLGSGAPIQRYVLSASGGNNVIRYFATMSYYNQIGLFNHTKTEDFDSNMKFNRLNFSVNLDYDVNKNFTVGLSTNGRSESRREPGDTDFGYLMSDLRNLPPNAYPIKNQDGSYGGTSIYQNNPLARLQSRGYTRNQTRVLSATLTAKHKLDFITEGLSANILYSYDVSGVYTSGLTMDYEVYDFTVDPAVKYRTAKPMAYSDASFGISNRRNEVWAGLDYDRLFGKNMVKASVRANKSIDFSSDRLDYRGQQISARVDYGYDDRYFLGFVGSYAGSENFAPAHRYGFFPAVSAGWVVFDGQQQKTSEIFNYLKLRTSYGIMGNGSIGGSRLPFRTLYSRSTTSGYGFGTTFANSYGADESTLGNPSVTWEELKRFNIGAELQFLKRSLVVSLDYFNDRRSNILTDPIIPGVLGIDMQPVNGGDVTSKGGEISFRYDKQIGKVLLSLNGNGTYAKNEVVFINEEPGSLKTQSQIGHNTGYINGTKRFYISEGLFQSKEEINQSPTQMLSGTVVPGDIKYKDISGPDGVPDGVISSYDAVNTNYTGVPDAYYGFGCSLAYQGFDFSCQWQGTHGRTIDIKSFVNAGPNDLNQLSLDRWTPETASTAKWPRLAVSDRGNNDAASDFWLRSGDYLKLKTVEIGFSLPKSLMNKLNLQKARIYVGGYNLLTFSKLNLDIDPENSDAGYGSSYPSLKTYTMGLNVQF
jgi:TonB-linked SusC/RagA family outer membrane protein